MTTGRATTLICGLTRDRLNIYLVVELKGGLKGGLYSTCTLQSDRISQFELLLNYVITNLKLDSNQPTRGKGDMINYLGDCIFSSKIIFNDNGHLVLSDRGRIGSVSYSVYSRWRHPVVEGWKLNLSLKQAINKVDLPK